MDKFIAKSNSSKKALKSATLASTLPVNILIVGEEGVGKKLLSKEISKNGYSFDIQKFQILIKENKINFDNYNELILYNVEKANNLIGLMKLLNRYNIKVIATSTLFKDFYNEFFLVIINIPPLLERREDLEELKRVYLEEAKEVFHLEEIPKSNNIEIDISKNGLSLKKSIFKSILFNSIKENELKKIIENFIYQEFEKKSSYKELLKLFEIPLLRASQRKYKSQLQMAKNLKLNRITLRKKLDSYKEELIDE